MKRILLLSLSLLMLGLGSAMAQRTVTGKVTSATDGYGIPGTTVRIKGTSQGVTTDFDGNYRIEVPGNDATLAFSSVGFVTIEEEVGSRSTINVVLEEDVKQLDEVVVTGYSSSTKRSFTGSAKTVDAENLTRKNVANVSQALAGEVAGVRVINTSGQPGTVATVRIRGIGSVNGNRAPLYVVDGVPFTGGLNTINPSDIESTTVLKDAAATAIYGSRGANGVVVITTKRGRDKDGFIEMEANIGTNRQWLPRYNTIDSPEKYIGLSWEALKNEGAALGSTDPAAFADFYLFSRRGIDPGYNLWNVPGDELINPETGMVRDGVERKYNPEDWEDYGFQASERKEFNLKFGGATEKANYYTSFGFLDDRGYLINSDFNRLQARLNLNQEITDWISGGLNVNYARTESNNNGQSEDSGSIFWFVDNIPSIYPLFRRDDEGELITDPIFGGNQYDYGQNYARGFGSLTNAIADATYDISRDNRNSLNGNANLDFTILEGLTFQNRLGVQYFHNKFTSRNNKFYGSSAGQNGSIFLRRTELTNLNLLNMLRYNKQFGDHSIEVLAAHEATRWQRNTLDASGYNLVDPNVLDLSNAVVSNPSNSWSDEYALESYFGQVNYDFDQKYFLSATVRRDGSSRFVKDKWGTFGSVGAAWLVSSEDFMNSLPIFSNLKLKASYGLIGDQAGVGFYPGYNLFNVDNLNDDPAFSFDTKGNPDLTWETSKMFQTGVEFDLGNYISGGIDYYVKNTDNLIFDVRQAPSLGYAILTQNAGTMQNRGIEFDLTGYLIQKQDYRLTLSVNGESFSNEITSMPIDPATGEPKAIDVQNPYGWSEGNSVYDYYMREYAGVDPEDGLSMWNQYYADANGNDAVDEGEAILSLADYLATNPEVSESSIKKTTTKTYSNATQKYVGKSAIPDVRGAFNLAGGYKGFDLTVQMLYSIGGYSYDYGYAGLMRNTDIGGNNWHEDITNRWQQPGDVTDVPRLSNDLDPNVTSTSTRFLTDASYLILNNVRLSYTLPNAFAGKYGLGGMSVWVSGDNLMLRSARAGFNPSTAENGNSSTYRYSPLSTVSAGLRIKL